MNMLVTVDELEGRNQVNVKYLITCHWKDLRSIQEFLNLAIKGKLKLGINVYFDVGILCLGYSHSDFSNKIFRYTIK